MSKSDTYSHCALEFDSTWSSGVHLQVLLAPTRGVTECINGSTGTAQATYVARHHHHHNHANSTTIQNVGLKYSHHLIHVGV